MGVLVVAVRSIPERIGHPFHAREALERNEGPAAGIVATDAGERCDDPDVLIGVECTWCGGEEATPPTAFLDLHNFAACVGPGVFTARRRNQGSVNCWPPSIS
jgi:hypothetical protein